MRPTAARISILGQRKKCFSMVENLEKKISIFFGEFFFRFFFQKIAPVGTFFEIKR